MESQKLVPVNCSDSQGGGISQMGQFQLSGEISHPGPSFSLIQNIQKYVLCLPEKMTVNPCPKDNNNNNLDFSPLMCTEHLSHFSEGVCYLYLSFLLHLLGTRSWDFFYSMLLRVILGSTGGRGRQTG